MLTPSSEYRIKRLTMEMWKERSVFYSFVFEKEARISF